MSEWIQNSKTAKILRNICFAGWFLCMLAATTRVSDSNNQKLGAEMLLFIGIFPLFFGAVIILQKRMKDAVTKNWVPVLFRGVPRQFIPFYYAFFYAVWLVSFYLMMRENLQKLDWPSLGISSHIALMLIPSVFYITSAGAYWSAAIEATKKK
jgi:hypothetical protein